MCTHCEVITTVSVINIHHRGYIFFLWLKTFKIYSLSPELSLLLSRKDEHSPQKVFIKQLVSRPKVVLAKRITNLKVLQSKAKKFNSDLCYP